MRSFLKLSVAGSLFLLATLLHRCGVQSASMRQHKAWGGETDARQPGPYFLPSADMVKALEYIERLRQQSDQDTEETDPDYDSDMDRLRSQLRIGPVQKQEEPDRDLAIGWQDVKSEQRLKTLLKTLQQASLEPKAAAAPLSSRVAYGNRQQADDREDYSQTGRAGDYGGYPFRERSKPHKKYPLMLEDEDSRESPYKRTNENVEEQYTPQSLATLQSVFEELGKLSAIKGHKRQSLDDDQFYRGDDDDIYRVNNLAYEDVAGGEEWTPVEEKVETEEVVKDSREEFDRGADENDEDDDDEDDDEDDTIKRSSQPARYREQEDPDSFTKLVDYYLLKILEKSEQTEQKRDRAEEQDTAKRLARASYKLDPQAIYQLIEISEKLQIPPEDLIEMLKSGEIKKQDKMLEPEEETDEIDRVEEKLFQISSHNKDKSPTTKSSNRRLPELLESDIPDDLNTDDILSILGLESMGNQKAKYFQKQRKPKNTQASYYAPSGRRGNYIVSDPSLSDKREADYDDTVAEDEVATYLAAKMLAQYPKVINKMDNKRASKQSPKDEQLAFGTFEQAMLNYYDQLAAEKSLPVKRLPESDDNGDSQRLDDETLLKMLEYLSPETNENEERDPYGKPIGGM